MRIIDLAGSDVPLTNVRHIIDYKPAAKIEPNAEMLRKLHNKSRRSRYGVRQSEHSRKRQNFITGVDVERLSPTEQRARREYMDELNDRMRDNG